MNNEASPSIYYIWEGCFYESKSHFKIFTFFPMQLPERFFCFWHSFYSSLTWEKSPVSAGIVAVYILSCFSGGFMSGKILRKDKYLWGILVGAFYYLLLITVSFVVQGKWEMSLVHAVTTFFMCLGGGALGGMLS